MSSNSDTFFSLKQILRLYHTVKYLKWQQVYFRFYYPIKREFYRPSSASSRHLDTAINFPVFEFPHWAYQNGLYFPNEHSFCFLNKSKKFSDKIDWNFSENGMLWLFHLHYFDWLNDPSVSVENALDTIFQYIENQNKNFVSKHSYPASLRLINWVKFIIGNNIKNPEILQSLYRQSHRLSRFPEYELQANHLLENGIALVWVGHFFNEPQFLTLGEKIVETQLGAQILNDGAHFEKSPSYHSVILKSIMELAYYLKSININNFFYDKLINTASKMFSHLSVMSISGQGYPNFGDSNNENAISFSEVSSLARNLNIDNQVLSFSDSGFRKFEGNSYQLFFNCGNITAQYQPGHSHADAFSFCLYVEGVSLIVDRGVSTYERNKQRLDERSTSAHNTLCIAGENSADIWSAFRLGKRANVKIASEDSAGIDCEHDGYFRKFDIIHSRKIISKKSRLEIFDYLKGWKNQSAYLYLHFHPNIKLERKDDYWLIEETNTKIIIQNADTHIEYYQYCEGFNNTQSALRIVGRIKNERIKTIIDFQDG